MRRFAVGFAVLACSLASTGVAHAAIAGAPPLTTDNRADLRSATTIGDNVVQYCFDKNLGNTGGFAGEDFAVGGYRNDSNSGAGGPNSGVNNGGYQSADFVDSDPNDDHCVLARFTSDDPDFETRTIAFVDEGAVRAEPTEGGGLNRHDSTALQGSTTQNGTRGFTTAPDILPGGVQLSSENDQILFFLDQDVQDFSDASVVSNNRFFFIDGQGNRVDSVAAGGSGNVIVAQFGVDPGDAQKAGYCDEETCEDNSSNPNPGNAIGTEPAAVNQDDRMVTQHVTVPGQSGITDHPDLTSNELTDASGATQSMDFRFDQGLATCNATDFAAVFSDALSADGDSCDIVGDGQTVRVQFDNIQNSTEYVVRGAISDFAVTDNQGSESDRGGLPAGGNDGAFAEGFTTGPDAFSATADQDTGVVRVLNDQRVFGGTSSCFRLLDSTGTEIDDATSATYAPPGTPGEDTVEVQFDPQDVFDPSTSRRAVALEMIGSPDFGVGGSECGAAEFTAFNSDIRVFFGNDTAPLDYPNATQIVQLTNTAALSAARKSGDLAKAKKLAGNGGGLSVAGSIH